jgi:hypothetical protein
MPREDESDHIFRAGRLFQELIVDAWASVEQSRLRWVSTNQDRIRRDVYQGLVDAIQADPAAQTRNQGQRVILPSSFTGGARDMAQSCQDALAINRFYGGADLFLTATANPYWPEVERALLPGQTTAERPDLVGRAFKLKMDALIKDIEGGALGVMVARVHTIEFQKRGLPHMHMILFLAGESKLRTPEDVDRLLSAELPDPDEQPELHELVKKYMVHGPCGDQNRNAPCMVDGKCMRNFPKPFREVTTISDNAYASYRRRNTGRTYLVREKEVDNRWVVPHCAYLIWKYQCHINLESVFSLKSIKYIYKYVYKGGDRATVEFSRSGNVDEVKLYLDARYITASEGIWRMFEYNMHIQKPAVVHLQVHLENQQSVIFSDVNQPQVADVIEQGVKDTTLTGFFKANAQHPQLADGLLYHEFPQKFVWQASKKVWKPRQRGFAIGRMYYVHPASGERFYLRLLLTVVKGPTSFEDVQRHEGRLYPTCKSACIARGLLEDDNEWVQCLQEAAHMQTGRQLRQLFATILTDCGPSVPVTLWEQFRENICDDLGHALRNNGVPEPPEDDIYDYGLFLLEKILQQKGRTLAAIEGMPMSQINWDHQLANRLILDERDYNRDEQTQLAEEQKQQFNEEQRAAFDTIVAAVDSKSGQCFFLQGAGGCGKTFVYSALCRHFRGQGKIVLCVASSGIAALLLEGGRTAHSRFKIPLAVNKDTVAGIKKNSMEAELIQETDLILWDEALMQHRHIFDAVNCSLQDIRDDNRLFGGITAVFGGDYQQILPVILKGTRGDIIDASLMSSPLWRQLQLLRLQTNMRVGVDAEEREFARWLIEVGHGQHTDETGNIVLPERFCCPENTVESLVQEIYSGIDQEPLPPDHYFAERAILSAKNADVDELNRLILEKFPGIARVHNSADSIIRVEGDPTELLYPTEYLNSINASGLALAKLELKVGCPVTVLRNLDPTNGICNGTRAVVTRMTNRVLEIRLINGKNAGSTHFIPRIKMDTTDIEIPFPMRRIQFPVRLAFAMSINKAQGQSLKYVGLDFRSPVFTHGQFYVAVSRATSVHRIRAIWDPNSRERSITKNIVYQEVLP